MPRARVHGEGRQWSDDFVDSERVLFVERVVEKGDHGTLPPTGAPPLDSY